MEKKTRDGEVKKKNFNKQKNIKTIVLRKSQYGNSQIDMKNVWASQWGGYWLLPRGVLEARGDPREPNGLSSVEFGASSITCAFARDLVYVVGQKLNKREK